MGPPGADPRPASATRRVALSPAAGIVAVATHMPELPDIDAYLCALESRIVGRTLQTVRVVSAFLLRTAEPPIAAVQGQVVRELRRIGKRIAIGLGNDLWMVIHLMIAGRLHWRAPGVKLSRRGSPPLHSPTSCSPRNGSACIRRPGRLWKRGSAVFAGRHRPAFRKRSRRFGRT